MYRLTDEETRELGLFLRVLCRMNRIDDAKRISKMPDGHISILIQSEKLWEAADGPQVRTEDHDPTVSAKPAPRPPIDFSRPLTTPAPLGSGQDRKL